MKCLYCDSRGLKNWSSGNFTYTFVKGEIVTSNLKLILEYK